jgi:hypothetical protein
VSLDALRVAVAEQLGADVALQPLYHGALPDSMEIMLLRQAGSTAPLVLMYSPAAAPLAAGDAATRSQAAAKALGPQLSGRVALPLLTGKVEGRTYSVQPLLTPLARARLGWWMQRALVRPALLQWLHGALARTARAVDPTRMNEQYLLPLEAIAEAEDLSVEVRRKATYALDRLQRRRWQPVECLMHGDLWRGNLMLKRDGTGVAQWAERLTIIDWSGARIDGYPLVDLVRAAESLALPRGRSRQELLRHCATLQCEPDDAHGYVLAAVGALALEPEYFPRPSFLHLVNGMDRVLTATLSA